MKLYVSACDLNLTRERHRATEGDRKKIKQIWNVT